MKTQKILGIKKYAGVTAMAVIAVTLGGTSAQAATDN